MDLTVAPWLPCASWDDWSIKRWPNADSQNTVLMQSDKWWMSDLPMDLASEYELFARAEGHVLITGLGLGVVAAELCRMPQVTCVHVIDNCHNLYRHVGSSLRNQFGNKVLPLFGDALVYVPSSRYDWVWHDIWLQTTRDNRPDYHDLAAKIASIEHRYKPFCKNQLSWWPRPPRGC